MAAGDESEGDVVELMDADTLCVAFDAGPRAGSTFVVRCAFADAWELAGEDRFLGQGAFEVAAAWLGPVGSRRVRVREWGQDQFGRLVCSITTAGEATSLGSALIASGHAVPATINLTVTPHVWTSSDRRAGPWSAGELLLDPGSP